MTTAVAERAVLDTNVLLAATDEGREEHAAALGAINSWPAAGVVLYTSGQILREYLVVATRPPDANGLGMSRSDAVANTREFGLRLTLLAEDAKVHARLLQLLDTVECTGKRIHDANIVATMLVHGIDTIVTSNTDDFAPFAEYLRIVPPR